MELETFTTGDAHELNGLISAERRILEAIPKKPISGSHKNLERVCERTLHVVALKWDRSKILLLQRADLIRANHNFLNI